MSLTQIVVIVAMAIAVIVAIVLALNPRKKETEADHHEEHGGHGDHNEHGHSGHGEHGGEHSEHGGHDEHHGGGHHGGNEDNKNDTWKIWVRLATFVVVAIAVSYWIFLFVRHLDEPMEYPRSGKAIATMKDPVKAYLDPEKTYTRILGVGNAKYVLESDPERFFICNEKPEVLDSTRRINNWAAMPAGKYLVYPEGYESIVFKWWQQKE